MIWGIDVFVSRRSWLSRGIADRSPQVLDVFLVALTEQRNGDRSGREARRSMAARRRAPI
jgi:hypothetical protein